MGSERRDGEVGKLGARGVPFGSVESCQVFWEVRDMVCFVELSPAGQPPEKSKDWMIEPDELVRMRCSAVGLF